MAVLYRKYRPQTFAQVVGQKPVVQTLQNQVAAGGIAHAYLFTGSRGIGKTSVARILAKAVNCGSQKNGEPCAKCDFCSQIAAGNFLDLIEVDAASNTGVDNIRDLIEHIKFSPSVGKYKVFIIDEAHMLSKGAFNALLKTLEEPPAHAIFILATTEINKVPATIVSRTQRFDFKRLTAEELAQQIQKVLRAEKISLMAGIAELIAQSAEGSVRDALSMLEKVLTLGEQATLADCQTLLGITDLAVSEKLLGLILKGQTAQLPDFFSVLLERGVDLAALNRDFLEYLRKTLVLKITAKQKEAAWDQEALGRNRELAAQASAGELIFIIRLFLKSYKDLNASPSPEIPLLLASLEAAFKNTKAPKFEKPGASLKEPALGEVSLAPNSNGRDEILGLSENDKSPVSESSFEVAAEKTAGASVGVEEISSRWPEVVKKVKQINSPLADVIKHAFIEGVSGSGVVIGVKFLFHKQSLESPKNQSLLAAVLKEVFGLPLGIRAKVVKQEEAADATPSQSLDNVLKVFGGELIK